MRLALAPINPTVGHFEHNTALILTAIEHAHRRDANLLLLPELALTAYPPRDLLLRPGFLARAVAASHRIAAETPPALTVLLPAPWQPPPDNDPTTEPAATDPDARPTNSVLVIQNSRIAYRYDKRLLPDYDIFDETRYFRPGSRPGLFTLGEATVGIAVCEDLWRAADTPDAARNPGRYAHLPDPLAELAAQRPALIALANASPFVERKAAAQAHLLASAASRARTPIASVNLAGANDDLIFDAHAALYIPDDAHPDRPAQPIAAGTPFDPSSLIVDLPGQHPGATEQRDAVPRVTDPFTTADNNRLLVHAITIGIRDYARKSGLPRATLGLSGGIDSALVATLAAIALGPDNLLAVRLPSRYTSDHAMTDAERLARNLGITLADYPINPAHTTLEATLATLWPTLQQPNLDDTGVTEENLQSRIRGLAMMAVSNKANRLLLTTGNKSEHATGYATLYGDQNGGLAPIADLLKTECYALARHINRHHADLGFNAPPIPDNTISKPPSAELKPGQTDQDTLPPYDTLDDIIERYIDQHQPPERIVCETGFEPALVNDIVRRIDRNEYKRFQLGVALKLRPRAFGPGRRHPLAQHPPQSSDLH